MIIISLCVLVTASLSSPSPDGFATEGIQSSNGRKRFTVDEEQCAAFLSDGLSTLSTELTQLNEAIEKQDSERKVLVEEVKTLRRTVIRLDATLRSMCVVNGKLHTEGELHLNLNCTISECHQGSLRPYQGLTAPYINFPELVARGCVYLEPTPMTWEEARDNCRSREGDLFVAGDLQPALQYIRDHMPHKGVWVGARNRTWLDNRTVTSDEWYPEEPSGEADQCNCFVHRDDGHRFGVADWGCHNTTPSLCQKGVTFQ